MLRRLCCLCLLCAACTRSVAPELKLSEAEAASLDYIVRVPGLTITHLRREADGGIVVWTRQGDGRRRYRIDESLGGESPEDRVRLLPEHPIVAQYPAGKERGTWNMKRRGSL